MNAVEHQCCQDRWVSGEVLVELDSGARELTQRGVLANMVDGPGHHLGDDLPAQVISGEAVEEGLGQCRRAGTLGQRSQHRIHRNTNVQPVEELTGLMRIPEPAQSLEVAHGDEDFWLGPIIDEGALGIGDVNASLVLAYESISRHTGVRVGLEAQWAASREDLEQER